MVLGTSVKLTWTSQTQTHALEYLLEWESVSKSAFTNSDEEGSSCFDRQQILWLSTKWMQYINKTVIVYTKFTVQLNKLYNKTRYKSHNNTTKP